MMLLAFSLSVAAQDNGQDRPVTPVDQIRPVTPVDQIRPLNHNGNVNNEPFANLFPMRRIFVNNDEVVHRVAEENPLVPQEYLQGLILDAQLQHFDEAQDQLQGGRSRRVDAMEGLPLHEYNLIDAFKKNDVERVRQYVSAQGFDATKTYQGRSLVEFAFLYKNPAMLRAVLDHGADINQVSYRSRETLLMQQFDWLFDASSYASIALLLQSPVIDPNIRNMEGKTVFMKCMELAEVNRGPIFMQIVQLLMQNSKVDVALPDNSENTALMVAVESGRTELVRMLLEDGRIDMHARNYYNKSAFCIALIFKQKEMLQLLIDYAQPEEMYKIYNSFDEFERDLQKKMVEAHNRSANYKRGRDEFENQEDQEVLAAFERQAFVADIDILNFVRDCFDTKASDSNYLLK